MYGSSLGSEIRAPPSSIVSLRIYLFQKDKKEKAQWNATTSPGDSGICVDMHPYFHAQKLQGHLQNVYCQTL